MKEGKGVNILPKSKHAQVTIFIIIAVIVVSLIALIYSFYPQIKAGFSFEEKNPPSYIQTCIEESIEEIVDKLSLQGGTLVPQNYVTYKNEQIEYLCYTNEYYKPCVMQKPMLKESIESEIENEIKEEVGVCFNSMKESYQKKGYSLNLKEGETKIELLPQKIVSTFNYSLVMTKGEESEKYDIFRVVLNNNLYELISITNSILDWEATYGDAETTFYMDYYHNLRVEKLKQTDGTTIYILTDRDKGDKFQFASRSIAWPPGY